jgi:xanthine dehydrogenase YagS FAD-binding subunit
MRHELPPFTHLDAGTADEAVSLLQRHGPEAALVAGGTDLLGLLKDRVEGPGFALPRVLINVKPIPDLGRITEEADGGLRIGAAVTLVRIAGSWAIVRRFPAVAQAALLVGSTQLRAMGTIGGNLLQRPRCVYFRHPDFPCFKKGGRTCFAIAGEHRDYHAILARGRCVMAHPSDLAPALVALDASAVIAGPEGGSSIPLHELFQDADQPRETKLRTDQMLKEIRLPPPGPGSRQVFLKQRVRRSMDFALASVAVAAAIEGGICRRIRIVLGGVAPMPLRAEAAEALLADRTIDERLAREAAEAALAGAKPLRNNGYKADLARALLRRALGEIAAGE